MANPGWAGRSKIPRAFVDVHLNALALGAELRPALLIIVGRRGTGFEADVTGLVGGERRPVDKRLQREYAEEAAKHQEE